MISRANSASAAGAADLVDPQDRQEGAAGDAAGQQRADQARRFAVGVRLPGVHRGQAHLGAVADEQQHEGRVQPGRRQLRGVLDELVEEQRRFQPGLERRVGQEERAEQGQGDADRADQQVLPGRLQRAGVVVEVDRRGADQRGRFHRHPHQPQVVRQRHQGHHRQRRRTGWRRRRGWAGRHAGPGSPARRASRGRTARSGSRGRPCRAGRAAASRPARRRRRRSPAGRSPPATRPRCPSAPTGSSHGRQRFDGTANVTAAIARGNRISR